MSRRLFMYIFSFQEIAERIGVKLKGVKKNSAIVVGDFYTVLKIYL